MSVSSLCESWTVTFPHSEECGAATCWILPLLGHNGQTSGEQVLVGGDGERPTDPLCGCGKGLTLRGELICCLMLGSMMLTGHTLPTTVNTCGLFSCMSQLFRFESSNIVHYWDNIESWICPRFLPICVSNSSLGVFPCPCYSWALFECLTLCKAPWDMCNVLALYK